jgi:(2Fe-2S) ferredoxin
MNLNCQTKFLCLLSRSKVVLILSVFCLSTLASGYLEKSFASPAQTFAVINTNDSGAGSFRQALLDANANAGMDTIIFNIAPGGVQTIAVTSEILPVISDPVVIDATTQPGYVGSPLIELAGGGGSSSIGLGIVAGNTTVRGFVINNFGFNGIGISTNGGNRIEGNFIGTDISGTIARPNFGRGIQIVNSSNNVIGGTSPNARNLISGNSSTGIEVRGAGSNGENSNNVFQGNYIGTNIDGTAAIPNGGEGISIAGYNPYIANNNLIGGTSAGAGNLISGNYLDEINISGFLATGNIVQGNLIGTNAFGTQVITSSGNGIQISSAARNNIIGGTNNGAANVIAGSIFGSPGGGSGLLLQVGASGNVVQGNFIGTDTTGTVPLPNFRYGIEIKDEANNNTIGGVILGSPNIIAFNGQRGILLSSTAGNPLLTTGNAIRGNSIFFNGGLGIDFFPINGANQNDLCDVDTGVNNFQNYPVLASAVSNGANTNITGSLNSTANTAFTVDFYLNPTYDSSGFGEGKTYLGSANITTAGDCNSSFNVALPYPAAGNQFITATATDSNGNTSEFSQFVRATGTGVKANYDFDGDGRSDISVFRPANGTWYLNSSALGFTAVQFGISTDKITPVDFDGDGKTDIAVFRDGTWYWLNSSNGTVGGAQFGQAGDVPVPADYDGDGRSELAVYRSGTWYTLSLANNQVQTIQFGISTDKPVPADFDGDGKTDLAVYRDGIWYLLRSTDGFTALQFGIASDKPTVGDYDGDGKADLAVYRAGTWYVLGSTQGVSTVQFGIASDIPVAADYDGDGKTDIAVFRDGVWYILGSQQGVKIVQFGVSNDKPIPAAFVP